MFIGYFEENEKINYNIYYKNSYGWDEWYKDTFNPLCKNIKTLELKIKGKTYKERKNNLIELAKDWQLEFATLDWSYGELATISDYFYKNGKKYGLIKEFRENAII